MQNTRNAHVARAISRSGVFETVPATDSSAFSGLPLAEFAYPNSNIRRTARNCSDGRGYYAPVRNGARKARTEQWDKRAWRIRLYGDI